MVSAALALGVSEVAVRLLSPQQYVRGEKFYRSDAELGWALAPGYRGRFSNLVDFDTEVRVNSLGLRGPELDGSRPAILGLGDSFMFGHGVAESESFLSVAAKAAGATPVNAGVPGYDLCQAVDLGARLLPTIPVDAIVIAPCLANDEFDVSQGRFRTEVSHGYFVEPGVSFDPDAWQRRVRHLLFGHSHLVRMLRYSAATEWLTRHLGGDESINRRSLRSLLAAYQLPVRPEILEGDHLSATCLGKLAELTAAHEIPVVAVLVPDELEVVPAKFAVATRAIGESGLRFDPQGPARRLTALLAAAGIAVVDPTPELSRAVAEGEHPWFSQDRHFSPTGSRIVGERLGSELRRLLDRTPRSAPSAGSGGL